MTAPNEPALVERPAVRLVGIGARMSMVDDKTSQLWRNLMPRRHEIEGRLNDLYVSMRVYETPGMGTAEMFAPSTPFAKWAAVEVADDAAVPDGMQGAASRFPETMRSIFTSWLPASPYRLDDREHFELLGEDWSPTDPDAREQNFVPIRPRALG